MEYKYRVERELLEWENKMFKRPGVMEQASKSIGAKINKIIPQKMHAVITTTVKTITRTALFGAEYTPSHAKLPFTKIEDADNRAKDIFSTYQKIAVAEGAGTGAGGIMLSAVDFPALLAIKMKFLFELAHAYGYSTKDFSERVFILTVFQLTYAQADKRLILLNQIKNWDVEKLKWTSDSQYYKNLDWEAFQVEYRDAIDFRKMLQMVPGIGAIAGAWANYSILEEIREYAMNAYRLRLLDDEGVQSN